MEQRRYNSRKHYLKQKPEAEIAGEKKKKKKKDVCVLQSIALHILFYEYLHCWREAAEVQESA